MSSIRLIGSLPPTGENNILIFIPLSYVNFIPWRFFTFYTYIIQKINEYVKYFIIFLDLFIKIVLFYLLLVIFVF